MAVIAVLVRSGSRGPPAAPLLSEAMRVAGGELLIPVVQIGAAVAALGLLLALLPSHHLGDGTRPAPTALAGRRAP